MDCVLILASSILYLIGQINPAIMYDPRCFCIAGLIELDGASLKDTLMEGLLCLLWSLAVAYELVFGDNFSRPLGMSCN